MTTELVEEKLSKAVQRLEIMEKLAARAERNYRRDPSESNLLSLQAAHSVCRELKAEVEEWTP